MQAGPLDENDEKDILKKFGELEETFEWKSFKEMVDYLNILEKEVHQL